MPPEYLQNERTFVCFSCMRPNEYGNQFCKFCNAPISQTSSNDPLQMAYNEGMSYRKAVEGKPKLIIVIGIWALFFPTFIVSILTALRVIDEDYGASAFILFWMSFIIGGFSFVMLYRITKNYFSAEENYENEDFD